MSEDTRMSGNRAKQDSRIERTCTGCGRRTRIAREGDPCLMSVDPAYGPKGKCPGRYRKDFKWGAA